MGATCSSSSLKKYNDVKNYLNSKECETFTYAKAFSPLVKDLPYVIIIGENHFQTYFQKDKRSCSTFSGILDKMLSICSDPSSKVTVFLEEDMDERRDECNIKRVLNHVEDTENPFNVNRQKVLMTYLEKQYPSGIHVIPSDIFQLARGNYIHCDHTPSTWEHLENYTMGPLQRWLGLTDKQFSFMVEMEKNLELTEMRLEHFDDEIKEDTEVNTISKFANIIFMFLNINKTRLYHENIHEYAQQYLNDLFNDISWAYNLKTQKRKRDEEPVKGHGLAMGYAITFLGDLLNFYRIGKTKGIVLISYGQRHAETFSDLFEESNLYQNDLSIGERLDDHPKFESIRD